jgi:hypothetical protein
VISIRRGMGAVRGRAGCADVPHGWSKCGDQEDLLRRHLRRVAHFGYPVVPRSRARPSPARAHPRTAGTSG